MAKQKWSLCKWAKLTQCWIVKSQGGLGLPTNLEIALQSMDAYQSGNGSIRRGFGYYFDKYPLFSLCAIRCKVYKATPHKPAVKLRLHPRQKKCSRYRWYYAIHANVRKYENKIEEKASLSCWEPNPGTLQEQQGLSMTWVSLQFHSFDIFTLRSCPECLVWCTETVKRQPTMSIFSCYCCFLLLFCFRFSYL